MCGKHICYSSTGRRLLRQRDSKGAARSRGEGSARSLQHGFVYALPGLSALPLAIREAPLLRRGSGLAEEPGNRLTVTQLVRGSLRACLSLHAPSAVG